MVFINEKPDTNQLAIDRQKLLYITDDNLEERQGLKNGDTTCTTQKKKKQTLSDQEMQNLEDEVFWYAIQKMKITCFWAKILLI